MKISAKAINIVKIFDGLYMVDYVCLGRAETEERTFFIYTDKVVA